MTNYLLLPSEGNIEFPFWCLIRLFDKTVKNNDLFPTMVQKKALPIPSSALARISKRPLPSARVCGIPKLGPYSSMRTVNARNRARKPTGQASSSASTVSL